MAAYRYSGLNPKKISDIRGLAAIRMDISYKLHENVSSLLSITGLTGHGLVRQFLHRLAKGPHTHDPKTDNACRTKTGRPTKGYYPPPLAPPITGSKRICVNIPDWSLIVPLGFPSWRVPCPASMSLVLCSRMSTSWGVLTHWGMLMACSTFSLTPLCSSRPTVQWRGLGDWGISSWARQNHVSWSSLTGCQSSTKPPPWSVWRFVASPC